MDDLENEKTEVEAWLEDVRRDLKGEDCSEIFEDRPAGTGLNEVSRVKLAEEATQVVETLMSSSEEVSQELRSRVLRAVEKQLADRRRLAGFLEPLLKSRRIAKGLEISDVAAAIGSAPELIRGLELGTSELADAEERVIAAWMVELEEDEGEAVEALRRSWNASTRKDAEFAFGGSGRQKSDKRESDFVARVLEEMENLRRHKGSDDS